MRKLLCHQLLDTDIQRSLDEFSAGMADYGITESDVISVTIVLTKDAPMSDAGWVFSPPSYKTVIVYWSRE